MQHAQPAHLLHHLVHGQFSLALDAGAWLTPTTPVLRCALCCVLLRCGCCCRVPQLADCTDVMQQIRRRKGTRYTCLTPNIKVSWAFVRRACWHAAKASQGGSLQRQTAGQGAAQRWAAARAATCRQRIQALSAAVACAMRSTTSCVPDAVAGTPAGCMRCSVLTTQHHSNVRAR